MKKIKVSFCFGVCNEETVLFASINKISRGLEKILGKENYEIIIVENGSTDKTKEILEKNKYKNVKPFYLKERGLGLAYKLAINKAKNDLVVLSAVDLPFGFDDLKLALIYVNDYDIIFGSKMHAKSIVKRDWKRNLTSFIYQTLLKIFYKVNIKDTQGSIFLNRKKIIKILKYCKANDAFFTAELAIYGKLFNLSMIEIPVTLEKEMRPTRFKIAKDGLKIFKSIIKEHSNYLEIKNKSL